MKDNDQSEVSELQSAICVRLAGIDMTYSLAIVEGLVLKIEVDDNLSLH